MKLGRFTSAVWTLVFVASAAACAAQPPAAVQPTATATAVPATATPVPQVIAVVSPAQPLYAAKGEFDVGIEQFAIGEAGEMIKGFVVYPRLDLAPATAQGPYPLVIFSVGLAQKHNAAVPLLQEIASRGFVGLTWAPRGETASKFWAGAATRPLDLQRLIDYAGELNAPGGKLAGMIDTEKIAVVGQSSGGWTALQGGGAQMDLAWCDRSDLVAKLPYSNCPQFVPHQEDIAAMLGLPAAPEGLWPPTNDSRVDAVIAMSPDGDLWGADYEGLANVKVPTLVLAGSQDNLNVPELCAYPIYEYLTAAPKTLAVFEGGGHDLGWDKYSEQIKHLVIAFLLAKLKDDPEAAKALLPANVNFPGVKYETAAPAAAPSS